MSFVLTESFAVGGQRRPCRRARFILTGLVTALSCLWAGSTIAQERGPDGGRRGDRGDRGQRDGGQRGGFRGDGGPGGGGFRGGGGTRGGGPGGGGGNVMSLLLIEEVREEIGLQADQVDALRKTGEGLRDRMRPPEGFNFREASEEDRQKMFDEMRAKQQQVEEELRADLEVILLPDQMDRLDEIHLQQRGVRALADPDVQAKLTLSPQQVEEVKAITDSMGDRVREVFQSGDREQMRELMEAARDEVEAETLGVLTTEQKAKFEELKGEPFEMPEREGRFGRGGGPGGGGGGFGGRGGGPGGGGFGGRGGGPGGGFGGRGGQGGGRGGPGGGFGGRGGERGGERSRPE
ncbi:MAG: hypothetical protein AAGD07_15260 [Planctomycetota bacterium]